MSTRLQDTVPEPGARETPLLIGSDKVDPASGTQKLLAELIQGWIDTGADLRLGASDKREPRDRGAAQSVERRVAIDLPKQAYL
jgi:hypothetical protein